jgi:hypothetical protein
LRISSMSSIRSFLPDNILQTPFPYDSSFE